jgi:hypothetical protein
MLNVGILCVAIARARVAALNLTESLIVDLGEKRFDSASPEKSHAANLAGAARVSFEFLIIGCSVTLQNGGEPFPAAAIFLPYGP